MTIDDFKKVKITAMKNHDKDAVTALNAVINKLMLAGIEKKAAGEQMTDSDGIQKAKSMVPLLVPLFVSAFRRATDLAMAMEARCYRGGEGRTKMKPLKYAKRDRMVYGAYLVYFAAAIVLKVLL